MTDADTAAAVKALTHRIQERDEAMRNGQDYADAEPFAAEFIAALRAKGGWRPTAAKSGAPPLHAAPVPDKRPRAEELAAARAAIAAKAGQAKAAREADGETGTAA